MTPKISKISTDNTSFRKASSTDESSPLSRDEFETLLSPTYPSPWRSKIPTTRLNAIRRHFSFLDSSKLNEVSDDLENSWNCGICLDTAVDPCVTRCGHMYCHAHLSDWLSTRPSCPVCKSPCTVSEDIVRVFEREQLSPPLTPFAESEAVSQPSRTSVGFPFRDETHNTDLRKRPSQDSTLQPKSPSDIKLFLSDVYAHYVGLALRVLGLAILLAALLPGGFFSPSSRE